MILLKKQCMINWLPKSMWLIFAVFFKKLTVALVNQVLKKIDEENKKIPNASRLV